MAYYKLRLISEQLTPEQLMHARRFRDWNKFDRMTEVQKLQVRFEELEIYQDIIDPEYIPKNF
jgi:hypothetical protein